MGTINYRTGDVITFGTQDNEDNNWITNLFNTSKEIINNYDFEWFKVKPEYGYYEGTSVVIDRNYVTQRDIDRYHYPSFLKIDKDDAIEIETEMTQLRKVINEIAELMPITHPGWCMGYVTDPKEMTQEIDEALDRVLKEIRKEIS